MLAAPALAKPKVAPMPEGGAVLLPMRLGIESMRIARVWCQAGMDIDASGAAAVQSKAEARFEATWKQYRVAAARFGQQESVLLFEQRWRAYRMVFFTKPDAASARRVINMSDDIAGLARKAAAAIVTRGDGSGPMFAEVAEGLLLIERLMRQVLSRQWGVAPADVPIAIEADRKAFAKLLADLSVTPDLKPEFAADMQLARQQWGFFERSLAPGADADAARQMLRLGGRMNEVMESALGRLVG